MNVMSVKRPILLTILSPTIKTRFIRVLRAQVLAP